MVHLKPKLGLACLDGSVKLKNKTLEAGARFLSSASALCKGYSRVRDFKSWRCK